MKQEIIKKLDITKENLSVITEGKDDGQSVVGSDPIEMEKIKENSVKASYRQILKATSIFGGVQVFSILIGIIRVKFVAVLLGTAGVGIMGLLNAPIQLIMSITGLGIAFSAVRDVSEAHGHGDSFKIAKVIVTLRRWSWLTGMLGAVVTLSMASWLSKWSFGNTEYTWAFVWLSVTLLLTALSNGQKAILQGTRRLKDLAMAGVLGSALGLVTAIPLFYIYGLEGIVPSMVLAAATALFLSWYYSRRVKIQKISLKPTETWRNGLGMARLGLSMTLAGFIATLSAYILNAFISQQSGVEQVGLYNAGWGVVGQYTGIVFAAMATDYFPRLSAVQSDNQKVKTLVSQQGETALLIMAPMLSSLIVGMPLIVRVLYTDEFLPIVMFANLTMLGMLFKVISWAMGYVFLAKGEGRLFLILEIISGSIILALNLLFYYLYGLNGLGISFIISYVLGVIIGYSVLQGRYQFSYPRKFYGRFLATNGLVFLSFISVFIPNITLKYLVGGCILAVTTLYSYYKLNELMDFKQLIISKISRKIKPNDK
ncbi:O-antigen translocase [Saccharicrinis sp. GN24d3]|uniref:O-antigen translocase n=1 Tax=Saccharicrinis sp. GN24d3 TaxID=3458416 RepID=UPI004037242D